MPTLTVTEARDNLGDTLNRVAYGKERVLIGRRGKPLAALVPVEDLELLEELEDRSDVQAAREALAEMKRTGAKPVPLRKLKRDLGL
ncbi:MAG TPA: type II toxin-antitoxin system Phd/YefM family antitoxin [Acidobacteriota bacterium]|jgi:prevent-host-death family protein